MTRAAALRRACWRHPEAGAAGLAILAWLSLVLSAADLGRLGELHAAAHRSAPVLSDAAGWILMSVAMMVPVALPVVRVHALRALWARRQRTVALFLAGQLAVWTVFGAVAYALMPAIGVDRGAGTPLSLMLVAAALWQLVPAKWRSVRACHRITPLPPRGRRADVACARAGAVYGLRCVTSCWAVMLAMIVAGHTQLGLMALLAALVAVERLAVRPARLAVPIAATLAFAAAFAITS
jgi:predicted metal-binding membrane protein